MPTDFLQHYSYLSYEIIFVKRQAVKLPELTKKSEITAGTGDTAPTEIVFYT
jgi:hypothetical protein